MAEFEPKIVAFVCNWCTYAGADLTGTSRIKYASNVRIIRFPCTGRIDYMLLLKAFDEGADGIIVRVVIQTIAIIPLVISCKKALDNVSRALRFCRN